MEQFNSSLERHAKTNEKTLGTLRNWAKKLALTERPSTLLLALSTREKEWRLAYGELIFGLSLEDGVDWTWPEFRLVHRQIDSKDGLKLLDDLCTTGYLNLSDSDCISAPGSFTKAYRPSDSANQYLKVDWPIRTFEFDTENIFLGDVSGEDLTGKDLPYFPDSKTALCSRTIQSISERSHRMDLFRQGRLNAYLIDNRARFSRVRVDSNGIKAQVEWGTLSDETAEIKAYVESPDDEIQTLTVEPGNEGYHIPTGQFPQRFDIAIVTDSGDLVDWRHFMPYYDWGYEGVEVEIPAYEVTMMALQGESDVLEYKSGAYKEIRDDILESVVAFANRHGGTILIGVDDHGRILGLDEKPDKVEDKILKWIRSHIEPPIEPDFRYVKEHKVMLVSVKESENKPHDLRDRGFYIRSGSTDRHMTRGELDAIISGRQSGQSIFGRGARY